MKPVTISRLARACGTGVETVRYYQRRGLLPVPPRNPGGIRRYGHEEFRRLRFIKSAQAAGFTLEQIGELISLDASHDRSRARALAEQRIAALDGKIAELQASRDALQRLAKACGAGARGPCPIISSFVPESQPERPGRELRTNSARRRAPGVRSGSARN